MRITGARLLAILCSALVFSAMVGVGPAGASDRHHDHGFTCSGGSIPAGSYRSLKVTGPCQLDAGNVTVSGSVEVGNGGTLIAAFGGSDLTVGGSVEVGRNANLILGCEPEAFKCLNDPAFNDENDPGTLITNDSIGGNLSGERATMVIAHHNRIGRNLEQEGGGGGFTCDNFPLGPDGPPAYSTYEDNTIGGNASIEGLQTCWIGFIRNTVHRNVSFEDNATFDPDGNEVVGNTVGRNLNCSDNSPHAQIGDSMGAKNVVGGRAHGECRALV